MGPVIIRRRLVVSPLGLENADEKVVCPQSGATVALSRCDECGHSSGVVHEPRRGLPVVDCDLAPPETATVLPDMLRKGALDVLRSVPLTEILTPQVVCVRRETGLDVVERALDRHAIGAVPVVDEERRPVGMVSRRDLRNASATKTQARDVMSPTTIMLHESTPATHAAALMAFEGVHHIPVIDGRGELVGLVSSLDLLRLIGQLSGYLVPAVSRRQREERGLD